MSVHASPDAGECGGWSSGGSHSLLHNHTRCIYIQCVSYMSTISTIKSYTHTCTNISCRSTSCVCLKSYMSIAPLVMCEQPMALF